MTSSSSAEPEIVVDDLTDAKVAELYYRWSKWARLDQLAPQGDWTTWLMLGGRGAGKTRAGAEWVRSLAASKISPIALVGETMTEAIAVMIRGESGLLNVHPDPDRPVLRGTSLIWPNGVEAMVMSASDPDRFRGPQFAAAWCDELGCGAVDKGANQPNVFVDPKSAESGLPYFSNGNADPLMQRQFLRAHQQFWADSANNPAGMVDASRVYLWTWDARPFPAFPGQIEVWSDGVNHGTGHWLTGRLGGVANDELARAIAADHGVSLGEVAAAGPFVQGYQLVGAGTCREALEPVIKATGLSLRDSVGGLQLLAGGRVADLTIASDDLAATDKPLLARRRADFGEAIGRMAMSFVDRQRDYATGTVTAMRQSDGALTAEASGLVLNAGGARLAAERLLSQNGRGVETLDLALPPSQAAVEPGDLIDMIGLAEGPFLVTEIRDGAVRRVAARSVPNPALVGIRSESPRAISSSSFGKALPIVALAHLPPSTSDPQRSRLAIGAYAQPWPGSVNVTDETTGASLVNLTRRAGLGETAASFGPGPLGVWDHSSALTVRLYAGIWLRLIPWQHSPAATGWRCRPIAASGKLSALLTRC